MSALLPIIIALFYVGTMSELVISGFRSSDRRRLLTAALTVLFCLIAARALLPLHPVYAWSWVLGVGLYAAALVLAFIRGRQVPWIEPHASRWSIAGSVIWFTILLALTGATLWSFV